MKINFSTVSKQLKRINFYSSSSVIILGIFAILLSSATVVYATMYNNGQYYQLGTAGSSSTSYESINDTTNSRDHYVCNDGSLQRSYLIPNNTTAEWNAFKSATAGFSDLDTCDPIGSCNTDCTAASSGGGCPSGCSSSGSHVCSTLSTGCNYPNNVVSANDLDCGCPGGGLPCTGCGGVPGDCKWVQTFTEDNPGDCGGTCC